MILQQVVVSKLTRSILYYWTNSSANTNLKIRKNKNPGNIRGFLWAFDSGIPNTADDGVPDVGIYGELFFYLERISYICLIKLIKTYMKKLSNYQLSLLSLLVCVGFAVVGISMGTNLIWVGYLLIFIGALAFGRLLANSK